MTKKHLTVGFVVFTVAVAALVGGAFIGFELLFGGESPEEDENDEPEVYTGNFEGEDLPEDFEAYVPADGIDHTEISIADLGRSYLTFYDEEFHEDCRANNVRTTLTNHRSSNVIVTFDFHLKRTGASDIEGTGEAHLDGNNARSIRIVGPELLGRDFCIERDGTTEPHLVHVDLKARQVISTDIGYGEWDAENMVDYEGEIRYQFQDQRNLTYNIPLTYLEVGDEVYIDLEN